MRENPMRAMIKLCEMPWNIAQHTCEHPHCWHDQINQTHKNEREDGKRHLVSRESLPQQRVRYMADIHSKGNLHPARLWKLTRVRKSMY
jgi:hypothetical protein